ncbi:hypothetical protein WN943_026419 [Citrus x changshan-huyou]
MSALGTSPRQSNQPSKVPMELCFKFRPNTALLQANFSGRSNSAYTPKFPTSPLVPFNHTGTPKNNTKMSNGTKLVNRSILRAESHPLQLHGFNFFVVEQGSGNFDPNKHPLKFNLCDPIERNTEWCALGGWVAPRFLAHNPVVCMVHVLPPASTHKLGIEDGMD